MRFERPELPVPVLALILAAAPLGAQNLVVNPTFDRDLAGWSPRFSPQLSWSTLDANGSSSSGSALVVNIGTMAYAAEGIEQCVPLSPSTRYVFSGKSRVVPGQNTNGRVLGQVVLFEDPGCRGPFLEATGDLQLGRTAGQWSSPVTMFTTSQTVKSGIVVLDVVKDESYGTFAAQLDDIRLVPSSPVTLTIPASASLHGAAGAFFHTDLWLVNTSQANELTVSATLRCQSGTPCAPSTKTVSLMSRQAVLFKDVVASLFDRAGKAGVIELTYDAMVGELSATSRTYTPELPAPTNGTGVPALRSADARRVTVVPGLASSGGNLAFGFRSNAGVYNPGAASVLVTFTLHDEAGEQIGTPLTRTWDANEATQVNDVFASLGAPGTYSECSYLVVEASAPVFAYATVIDNQSGDSVFLTGSAREPAP